MKNTKATAAIKKIISHFKSIEWFEQVSFKRQKGHVFCYLNNYFFISRDSENYFFSLLKKNEHCHELSCGQPTSELVVLRYDDSGEPTEECYGFEVIKTFCSTEHSMIDFHHLYGCFGLEDPNEILDYVIQTEPPEGPNGQVIPF